MYFSLQNYVENITRVLHAWYTQIINFWSVNFTLDYIVYIIFGKNNLCTNSKQLITEYFGFSVKTHSYLYLDTLSFTNITCPVDIIVKPFQTFEIS